MYILDSTNYRVLKWRLGDPLGYVMAGGNGAGSSLTQITTSYAMFVDSQYNIYVSEYSNHRVTKWSPTNTTAGILVFIFFIITEIDVRLFENRLQVEMVLVIQRLDLLIHGEFMLTQIKICMSSMEATIVCNIGHRVSQISSVE